jgi:hypothetical protein
MYGDHKEKIEEYMSKIGVRKWMQFYQ